MRKYIITVNGKSYEVEVEEVKENINIDDKPKNQVLQEKTFSNPIVQPSPTENVSSGKNVSAPMPGTVLKIAVATGDRVKKGDVLLILEAMKMENEIFAPEDCRVKAIKTSVGASVNTGDTLLILE